MRITKEIAKEVALKLTETKLKEIEKLETERATIITDIYEKSLPEEIKVAYEKYPGYFNRTESKYVSGEGIEPYSSYDFTKKLPQSGGHVKVEPKQAHAIVKLDNSISDKRNKYRRIVKEIEVALFALRTLKNVEAQFPEALPHLPVSQQSTAVMVNISSIRSELTA